MIYRSNLEAPDLTPHFQHLVSRPMPHSFGHDVPSDWGDRADDDPVFGLYKQCGMWTHDEAAILYNVVLEVAAMSRGQVLDIGCHTGWTMAHALRAKGRVIGIDPMLRVDEFRRHAEDNLRYFRHDANFGLEGCTSREYFQRAMVMTPDAAVIDGDHEPGEPEHDVRAVLPFRPLAILFHDFIGKPVRDAVKIAIDYGYRARIYWTPHVVAACYLEGDPPEHTPDPEIMKQRLWLRMQDFDFSRTIDGEPEPMRRGGPTGLVTA